LDLYQRSVKLLEKVKVKFICATEITEQNLAHSMELANFATSLPMVQSFARMKGTVNEKPIVEDQPGWTRARIIVNRVEINGTPSFAYSITWSGDQSPVDIQGDWPSDSVNYADNLKTVLKALEMARDNGLKHLVVQMTSAGLVRTLSEWLPKWRKKQWKNSLGKPVKHEQLYRQIDDCLQDIEVKWEYQAAFTSKPTEPFDFDADLDYFMPVTISMT